MGHELIRNQNQDSQITKNKWVEGNNQITCRSSRRALPAGRRRCRLDFGRLELGHRGFGIIHCSWCSRDELVIVSSMSLHLTSRSRRLTKSLKVVIRDHYVRQHVYGHWWLGSLAHDFFRDTPDASYIYMY